MVTKRFAVVCADIGSVKAGRFGWFGISADGTRLHGDSSSIEELARVVTATLTSGDGVALGFECPLFTPLRDNPLLLTKARSGEGNRSWSAGAGCGALATGIVEVAWVLSHVRKSTPPTVKAFLDWQAFQEANGGLFLWEAFVSGKAKGDGHVHDAEIAVRKFQYALPNLMGANAITEESVFSLIGASLIRTDWSDDVRLLSTSNLVIKA